MKKLLSCLLCLLMLTGCATKNAPILNANQSIYIMLPNNSDTAQTYIVQQELKKNFQIFSTNDVNTALDSSTIKTGFADAKKQQSDLLVCPLIVNTTSGKEAELNIRIFDVKTQKIIDEKNLYKRKNNHTSQYKLLSAIIKKYVAQLY